MKQDKTEQKHIFSIKIETYSGCLAHYIFRNSKSCPCLTWALSVGLIWVQRNCYCPPKGLATGLAHVPIQMFFFVTLIKKQYKLTIRSWTQTVVFLWHPGNVSWDLNIPQFNLRRFTSVISAVLLRSDHSRSWPWHTNCVTIVVARNSQNKELLSLVREKH